MAGLCFKKWEFGSGCHTSRFAPYVLVFVHFVANLRRRGVCSSGVMLGS